MEPKKILYSALIAIIGCILGRYMVISGATMIGESGVSQEVINAIIGTIGCNLGYVLVIYCLMKFLKVCIIELFKPSNKGLNKI